MAAVRKCVVESRASFPEWVPKAVLDGKAGLFGWLTVEEVAPLAIDIRVNGRRYGALDEIMQLREGEWKQRWQRDEYCTPHFIASMVELRREATLTEYEPLTFEEVEASIRAVKPNARLGADGWAPRELQTLPLEGRKQLNRLFMNVEESLAWPWHLLTGIVRMVGKGSGGERPITH